MKTTTICLALLLAATSAFAETPSTSLTDNPIFQNNCARCHGKNAEGHFMKGPSLTSGKARGMSEDDLHKMIANGKGHMPKFGDKLTPQQIDSLVEQIKAKK